ncbi:MAG: TRIC cation channel family protein [Burkholderiales bacterium]
MVVIVVTAVGGGTVRDMVLGVPVFWLQDFTYVGAALRNGRRVRAADLFEVTPTRFCSISTGSLARSSPCSPSTRRSAWRTARR